MPKTPTNKRIVLKTGQNWGLKLLNLLKMANLTAHVEKEINLVDKCPFIEKANCNEGLVRLICDPLYWDWLQIVTLLLGSIPALAILLWYILACLGKYMDQIKGKNFKMSKILWNWFLSNFLEEEEMKRIEKVLRFSTTFDLCREAKRILKRSFEVKWGQFCWAEKVSQQWQT